MSKDTQARKYQLTLNNPADKGYTRVLIKEKLSAFQSAIYWCMGDEIGLDEQTLHTHIFIAFSAPVRFSTIKNAFPEAHIEKSLGTAEENRDYITKSGKWENSDKHGTVIADTFEEWGTLPEERQGRRSDLTLLYALIKSGASNFEILEENPNFLIRLSDIEKVRQTIHAEENRTKWRDLEVTYLYGPTGIGKTRGVMERFGYDHVCRVTDYAHPFETYRGEDVIIFDEFRSQLDIADMLNYLDGYPVTLPCRYNNRQACFTKVFIISNIQLSEQYPTSRLEQPETWEAFCRRIHKIEEIEKSVTFGGL